MIKTIFKRALFFVLMLALFFVSSCKKHENIIVSDNTPPPDKTISNSTKDSYVNRVYISLLGREPDSLEFIKAKSIINKNNFSIANRKEMVDTVIGNKAEYNARVWQIARINYLNNLDTADITFYIAVYNSLLINVSYQAAWPQITIEIGRLETLKTSLTDLNSGSLNVVGLYKRCVDNNFYDMINMGTENFVVSMYSNFLFRYPTVAELNNNKLMVDGQSSQAFLQSGKNKADYLSIFFSSGDFFEGQVRELYVRYLFRQPNSAETSSKSNAFKSSLDYKALQRDILSSNEYAGVN